MSAILGASSADATFQLVVVTRALLRLHGSDLPGHIVTGENADVRFIRAERLKAARVSNWCCGSLSLDFCFPWQSAVPPLVCFSSLHSVFLFHSHCILVLFPIFFKSENLTRVLELK